MQIGMMCHASFGGSGRIGIELALALARRGHRVHLFTRTVPLGGVWEPIPNVELHTLEIDGANEPHPSTLQTHWSDRDIEDYMTLIVGVLDTEGLDILHYQLRGAGRVYRSAPTNAPRRCYATARRHATRHGCDGVGQSP